MEGDGLVLTRQDGGQPLEKRLSLEALYDRVLRHPEQRRDALYAFVERVVAGVRGLMASRRLTGKEGQVYPVVRHPSSVRREDGETACVTLPHTAETVVAFAFDHGDGYLLIDHPMLAEAGWSLDHLHAHAMENLRKLEVPVRSQQVGPHLIHFISPRDGYAASRVLLDDLLADYDRKKAGQMLGVAIPHQDVLILADLKDNTGAQLLARLASDFAAKGPIPITPLPFLYDKGQLEPYLIVHKDKG
ncbi:DUF1444 family protein [Brevibacillus sp. SYP-B805]|nr:DUF1444 family protein [Brevibacillus sp. SYP-B805]